MGIESGIVDHTVLVDQSLHRLDHRPIGNRRRRLHGAAGQQPCPGSQRPFSEFARQAGLSDPSLTRENDQPPRTLPRLCKDLLEPRELGVPPHNRRADQMRHAEIIPPGPTV